MKRIKIKNKGHGSHQIWKQEFKGLAVSLVRTNKQCVLIELNTVSIKMSTTDWKV